jgi:hypothetical protein
MRICYVVGRIVVPQSAFQTFAFGRKHGLLDKPGAFVLSPEELRDLLHQCKNAVYPGCPPNARACLPDRMRAYVKSFLPTLADVERRWVQGWLYDFDDALAMLTTPPSMRRDKFVPLQRRRFVSVETYLNWFRLLHQRFEDTDSSVRCNGLPAIVQEMFEMALEGCWGHTMREHIRSAIGAWNMYGTSGTDNYNLWQWKYSETEFDRDWPCIREWISSEPAIARLKVRDHFLVERYAAAEETAREEALAREAQKARQAKCAQRQQQLQQEQRVREELSAREELRRLQEEQQHRQEGEKEEDQRQQQQ